MFVHFILSTSFRSEIQSAQCSVSSYLVSLVILLPLAQDVSHEYGNFLLNSNIPIWLQTFIFFYTRASFQFVRMFYTFTGCTYYITINTNIEQKIQQIHQYFTFQQQIDKVFYIHEALYCAAALYFCCSVKLFANHLQTPHQLTSRRWHHSGDTTDT